MKRLLVGLVGYSGKGLVNIVDIAFRNVIKFSWLIYFPLPKLHHVCLFLIMQELGSRWRIFMKIYKQFFYKICPKYTSFIKIRIKGTFH